MSTLLAASVDVASRPSALPVRSRTRRVLVADNDAIIRSVLRSLLIKVGQDVAPAATTEEALTLASATSPGSSATPPFDCVVLDLDMPTKGGLHVCRALRAEPAWRDVAIVVLTGLDNTDARARSIEAGATLFMTKPFNPADLMRALLPHLEVAESYRPRLQEVLAADRGLRLQDSALARGSESSF